MIGVRVGRILFFACVAVNIHHFPYAGGGGTALVAKVELD
jgi:hypothetical protein